MMFVVIGVRKGNSCGNPRKMADGCCEVALSIASEATAGVNRRPCTFTKAQGDFFPVNIPGGF
ncbi:hypothetical protein [Noviherbaspirillum massiliense]|uniref:hypothetical protein n=1 Tax=Noviherbaspirillum massiliense TaxID=1465823 RepID=UPI0011DDAEDD|nr:hypothetical protein [Noviherbaspirillum massiliense]